MNKNKPPILKGAPGEPIGVVEKIEKTDRGYIATMYINKQPISKKARRDRRDKRENRKADSQFRAPPRRQLIRHQEALKAETKNAFRDVAGELVISRAVLSPGREGRLIYPIFDPVLRRKVLHIAAAAVRALVENDLSHLDAAIARYQGGA